MEVKKEVKQEIKKEAELTIQDCLNCDGEGSATGKVLCEDCKGTGKVER